MNIRARLILLIIYIAVSMALLFLFGALSSHGPLQALYILSGWTTIIYVLLSLSGWPLFLALFILYLIILSLFSEHIGLRLRRPLPFLSISIHSIGAATCFLIPGRGAIEVGFFIDLLAWLVPIFIMSSYFFFEWRFARTRSDPEPPSH